VSALVGVGAHGSPDGKHLGVISGVQLLVIDGACNVEGLLRGVAGSRPVEFSFSPSGKQVAIAYGRDSRPGPGAITLRVFSLDGQERGSAALVDASPIVWLDEETVVYPVENGPVGTAQRTLRRLDLRTLKEAPLLAPIASCEDKLPSAPRAGGQLLFQRLCDDEKTSGIFRVTSANRAAR
jgi:hypothetical protein